MMDVSMLLAGLLLIAGCTASSRDAAVAPKPEAALAQDGQEGPKDPSEAPGGKAPEAVATFGAGCFWCVEAVFEEVDGVIAVESGYAGGPAPNPTYEQVCTGRSGHAEVCRIRYDPGSVGFEDLLEVFWKTHDPTTLNRQGNDSGPQYRSAIFYHDEAQKELALAYRKALDESGAWKDPIVTEIVPFEAFYPAEAYHQDYFANNPGNGYCAYVIGPKLDKFRKVFQARLKGVPGTRD